MEKTFGTKIGISDKFQYQISKQLLNNNFYWKPLSFNLGVKHLSSF